MGKGPFILLPLQQIQWAMLFELFFLYSWMKLQKAEMKWYSMSRRNFVLISSHLSKCFPLLCTTAMWHKNIWVSLAAGKMYHFSIVILLQSLLWVRKCWLLILYVFDANPLLLLRGEVWYCLYYEMVRSLGSFVHSCERFLLLMKM